MARSLFNGKDLNGWHADVPGKDKNPDTAASFIVRDGKLVSMGDPRGHLITDASYAENTEATPTPLNVNSKSYPWLLLNGRHTFTVMHSVHALVELKAEILS